MTTMIKTKHVWMRPRNPFECEVRLKAVSAQIRSTVLRIRMLRNAVERAEVLRVQANGSSAATDRWATFAKAAYIEAFILGELRVERANLRRWRTVHVRSQAAQAQGQETN